MGNNPGILKGGSFKIEADAADELRKASGVKIKKSNTTVLKMCGKGDTNFASEEAWIEARVAEMQTRQLTEISADDMKVEIDRRINLTFKKKKC